MKISILTLFPNLFENFKNESIIKRAIEKGLVEIETINIRDFSNLSNNQVDDTPYGGGSGMVMRCDIVYDALMSVKAPDSIVILTTPSGKVYKQSYALDLSSKKHIIIICGHYEGIDDRIRKYVDLELSIGDYILTGGELAGMVISDSIIRLIPGVITSGSLESESFNDNLLDYPVYTRPYEFNGDKVPDVLISGHHAKVDEWRKNEQIKRTKEMRPDLLKEE